MPTNKNAPAMAVARGVNSNAQVARNDTSNLGPVECLLSRLDRVRQSGRGWTARCPAHEDKTASLSVSTGDDGRVLVHCFAGCRSADVVAAAGLQLSDLFVRKPTAAMTFAERSALREHSRQAQWRAALNMLALEAGIVAIAGRQLKRWHVLNEEDDARLATAVERIEGAREVLNGRY